MWYTTKFSGKHETVYSRKLTVSEMKETPLTGRA